ncbi:MAG: 1,4-dihydroxy-2-naphthoyl-CoA synthase [Propionibacteriaceae bacterium]|jgi:naphthoate synthase|nr:1,4-dihydroxy-2-naphthoyl-CoA synthase [Propionibacteriaceae bacterium]
MDNPFRPADWAPVPGFEFTDLTYHRAIAQPVVRIAFDRPEVRNAFRPHTVDELIAALDHARVSADIGCVLLTGNGPSPKDGGWAFCSGGDQRIRGKAGYEYAPAAAATDDTGGSDGRPGGFGDTPSRAGSGPADAADGQRATGNTPEEAGGGPGKADSAGAAAASDDGSGPAGLPPRSGIQQAGRLGRLHILEAQRLIRFMPKPVIALVNGWAAGGGHSLHVVCDLTIASREHARFKQTDADVGSFDAGLGSAYLARQVGQKAAREIFFLGAAYDAERAYAMGAVNAVVPHGDLEAVGLDWAAQICAKSPTAIRMLKYAFNAQDDGLIGQQIFAGETTRLAYMTAEAAEGRDAFLEKRPPDWSAFPYYY